MLAAGLIVETLEVDGKTHRVDLEGEKKGKKHGWYGAHWLKLDNGKEVVVGAYGWFSGPEKFIHKIQIKGAGAFTEADKARYKAQQAKAMEMAGKEREAHAVEAARRAAELWPSLPDTGGSDYLQRKGVRGYGLRYTHGTIVVPLRNVAGKLVGLQFIAPDGSKKYLTGTAKMGAWYLLGEVKPGKPLFIAEGYATGASIHEATGCAVAICFDCGNLPHVAKALRSLHPKARLVIAGDDDHERVNKTTGLPENAGRLEGDRTAAALKCAVCYPSFKESAGRTDFNDLHQEQGLDALRDQLRAALKNTSPAGAANDDEGEGEALGWRNELVWNDRGMIAMPHNVMLILRNHPAWEGVLGYDDFAKRLVLRREPPCGGEIGPIKDGDEVRIAAWFGRKETFSTYVPTSIAREASIGVSYEFTFHPVRDYLESVKWDGIERIPTFFSDFCGSTHNATNAGFALNFFIACVARIFSPGCRARLMLVLEGPQDISKSTLARVLCGEEYFADLGTAASDKDFFQIIQGRWIVEISELASFARAEASHIKRAISTNIDRFRPSYGRNAEDFPRQCIFFGTVNPLDGWQKDPTGGSRFMPVEVREINIEAIIAIRDQLWAEAVHRYRNGEPWWKLPEGAKEEQDSRYEDDIWTPRIIRWLEGKMRPVQSASDMYPTPATCYPSGWEGKVKHCTVAQIMAYALEIEVKKQDNAQAGRVGKIMHRLGWKRKQVRVGGARIWTYFRPDAEETEPPDEA